MNDSRQTREQRHRILGVERSHVLAIADLPFHHKDPFDRMLIAQAMIEDMTVISADRRFADYDVKLMEW